MIGGEGRSAPSGLPIRTLTSINISASFLYRSGLARSLSPTLCRSSPSHPEDFTSALHSTFCRLSGSKGSPKLFPRVHGEVTEERGIAAGVSDVFSYLPISISRTHTWHFHNEEFHGASGWPKTRGKAASALTCRRERERERRGRSVMQQEWCHFRWRPRRKWHHRGGARRSKIRRGHTGDVIKQRGEEEGDIWLPSKQTNLTNILLNMHPRLFFITHTHTHTHTLWSAVLMLTHTHKYTQIYQWILSVCVCVCVCVCLFCESSALPIASQFAHPHGVI